MTEDAAVSLRPLDTADIEPMADLWSEGWAAGHAGIVPEGLLRHRTRKSFRARLLSARDRCLTAGPVGAPLGFVRIEGDELDQFYIRPDLRGTGFARRLMRAAEGALCAAGVRHAWLACTVGNMRAARFYEGCGWRQAGILRYEAETTEGTFTLDVWRYEKDLCPEDATSS